MDVTRPDVRSPASQITQMREAAERLEGAFLSEMLKAAGLGKVGSFGGGIGEEQFASFLREEQATAMVKAGGIGLAQPLFDALMQEKTND